MSNVFVFEATSETKNQLITETTTAETNIEQQQEKQQEENEEEKIDQLKPARIYRLTETPRDHDLTFERVIACSSDHAYVLQLVPDDNNFISTHYTTEEEEPDNFVRQMADQRPTKRQKIGPT